MRPIRRAAPWLVLALACNQQPSGVQLDPAPSASSVSGAVKTGDEPCRELAAVLECMHDKGPPRERAALDRKRGEVMARLEAMGDRAREACRQALDGGKSTIESAGCQRGRDSWQQAKLPAYAGLPAHPLPDDCEAPRLVVASAPRAKGLTYAWPWARQVVFAHPAFRVVGAEPSSSGEVRFEVVESEAALTLVATCWDAATCNALASSYGAVVRSSAPRLFCKSVPLEGDHLAAFVAPPNGRWLPDAGDWAAGCGRIASCRIALDPSTPGDPGLECQRDPSKVALGCALRARCGDVVACLESSR